METEESAFHGIMSSLTGQASFEYNKLRLQEKIKGLEQSASDRNDFKETLTF